MENTMLNAAVAAFPFEGAVETCDELHAGNINNTYYLRTRDNSGAAHEYILQRVNKYAFKDPQALMRNIGLVTRHLEKAIAAGGEDPADKVLRFITAGNGTLLFTDAEGQYWRSYHYVGHAVAHNRAESPVLFSQAGKAFGKFQRLLIDFPAAELTETIPGFHNTRKRFFTFTRSVEADAAGRVKADEDIIDEVFSRRRAMCQIVDKIESGELPLRVTHNDTKINNVLLDEETGREKCVIDLDTVMPGVAAYDFGDAIRFGASTAAEDEEDTGKISLDLDLYTAFCEGFVGETAGILTPAEIMSLPLGVRVITTEQVTRFLTDYLDGDKYFKIRYPEHNIVRARAQLALLRDVEKKYGAMCEITRKIAGLK